jgi:hypothetical protein
VRQVRDQDVGGRPVEHHVRYAKHQAVPGLDVPAYLGCAAQGRPAVLIGSACCPVMAAPAPGSGGSR